MIHFTWFDVAVLVAFYFWPVVAGITAVLAAIGWLRPATRQHRPWRLAMRGTAALLLVDSLLAAPFALWFVGEWVKAYETTCYSYRLERIERIDGIIFPAGSEVQLSVDPPHSLESGTTSRAHPGLGHRDHRRLHDGACQ